MRSQLEKIQFIQIGKKMLTTKITYALADWIREWRKCRNEDPSLDDCIKFAEWKIENYKLTDSDRMIIESILLYETEESQNF